jgi:hypothetical protein
LVQRLQKRGVAPLQLIIVLVIVIIIGGIVYQKLSTSLPLKESADNTNMAQTTPENPTTHNPTQEIKQEYKVTDIIIDRPLVPSGIPVGITVKLEKISGQDPFSITLIISGDLLESRDIYFGDLKEIDTHIWGQEGV